MAKSSLLLFGPVSSRPRIAHLHQLQHSLLTRPNLRFIAEVIEELPSLWPSLRKVLPDSSTIEIDEHFQRLSKFLECHEFTEDFTTRNTVSAPLTVISQIVDFLKLDRALADAALPQFDNVQGFCIGFLPAAALAASKDEKEFRTLASVAIRLAVCMGAVVDVNESSAHDPIFGSTSIVVRWKADSGKIKLEDMLKSNADVGSSCIALLSLLLSRMNHFVDFQLLSIMCTFTGPRTCIIFLYLRHC